MGRDGDRESSRGPGRRASRRRRRVPTRPGGRLSKESDGAAERLRIARRVDPSTHGERALTIRTPPGTRRPEPTAEADAARAAGGDPAAFERLYREHVARIHSLARRMAGEEVADDLTQEVFIRAWEKLPTFRGDAAFGTWLHRLAVNWILSRRETSRRRESKRVAGDGVLELVPARRDRPGLDVDLERAMERLPDRAKRVFVLYDVEGYPHEEIAGLMGISVGTSKSQLHRARMLLREELGGGMALEAEARP